MNTLRAELTKLATWTDSPRRRQVRPVPKHGSDHGANHVLRHELTCRTPPHPLRQAFPDHCTAAPLHRNNGTTKEDPDGLPEPPTHHHHIHATDNIRAAIITGKGRSLCNGTGIGGEAASRPGPLDRPAEPGVIMETARGIAAQIATLPPMAIRSGKRTLQQNMHADPDLFIHKKGSDP